MMVQLKRLRRSYHYWGWGGAFKKIDLKILEFSLFFFFKKCSELFALASILYGDQRSNTESGLHGLRSHGFLSIIKTP